MVAVGKYNYISFLWGPETVSWAVEIVSAAYAIVNKYHCQFFFNWVNEIKRLIELQNS